ncbi:MAG: two-component system response regulator, partial [Anaerolineales bacterium]|nr:two-component system response regulator [Anaerolineales bacterium]
GLDGAKIPLAARVTAIIDVWDALKSDRPYRKAWSPEKTTAYIHKQSGKQFDPEIVDVFFQLM